MTICEQMFTEYIGRGPACPLSQEKLDWNSWRRTIPDTDTHRDWGAQGGSVKGCWTGCCLVNASRIEMCMARVAGGVGRVGEMQLKYFVGTCGEQKQEQNASC